MSWCRAVWLEGSVEEELTIPLVWVEEVQMKDSLCDGLMVLIF